MKVFQLYSILFLILILPLSAYAQTSNGEPLRSYSLCIKQEPLKFTGGCLGDDKDGPRSQAKMYITNICDQPVDVEYVFTGHCLNTDGSQKDCFNGGPKTEYNLKPGKRVYIYFCNTSKNSGVIRIVSVSPVGGGSSSSSGGSSSSNSSSSAGFGSSNTGSTSGSPSSGFGFGSSSGTSNGSNSNHGESGAGNRQQAGSNPGASGSQKASGTSGTGTASTASGGSQSDKPSFNSKEEYEAWRDKQKAGREESASSSREGETVHEEHVRKNNERVARQKAEQKAERARQEEVARQQHEQELKRQQELERQRRAQVKRNQQNYDRLKAQSRDNMRAASEMGAAAILVHYLIGTQIYQMQNSSYKSQFNDYAPHTHFSMGYGLSMHSLRTTYRNLGRSSGNTSSETSNSYRPTIDLGVHFEHWSFHSNVAGIGFAGDLWGGHGLLFETFKWGASAGIKTHLTWFAFNAYTDYGQINYNTWIDPTSEVEEEEIMFNGRIETGLRFGSEGDVHNILLVMQRPFQAFEPGVGMSIGYGLKYEGKGNNGLRFVAEYIDLPAAYGSSIGKEDEDATPFQARFGVYKSLDWYKQLSFNGDYDNRVLHRAHRNKTWFFTTNGKLTFGGINPLNPQFEHTLERLRPNLSFQMLIEKTIPVHKNLFGSLGAGFTTFRRIDAEAVYDTEKLALLPTGNFYSQAHATFDLPLGVLYSFKPLTRSDWSPWLAFNTELVFNIFEVGEPSIIGYEDQFKSFYTMLQFGAGFDSYYGVSDKLRWGVYYEFAPSSLMSEAGYRPHGLVFSLKHGL